jgi:methionine synthase II (cobalamin-independent)
MTAQYAEGFPGVSITEEDVSVSHPGGWEHELEALYSAYITGDAAKYAMSEDSAAGFYAFQTNHPEHPMGVKGQVEGPVSWGLSVKDETDTPIVYDDILAEAAAKMLSLKVTWQEALLREISPNTVMFIDEPALTSYGSAYLPLSKEKIHSLLAEVLSAVKGVKGVHCCGNTDWTLLTESSTDIISFDAYNYANSLALYPDDIRRFIQRGGAVAWGIVPNTDAGVEEETPSSLKDRLEEAIVPFTRAGLNFKQILRQSLITPSCGMAYMSEDASEKLLETMVELTAKMRSRYL